MSNETAHPALQNVPKTRKEALQRVLLALQNGGLQKQGTCDYGTPDGKPCAVGFS